MKYLIFALIFNSYNLYANESFRSNTLKIKNASIHMSAIDVHKEILKIKNNSKLRLKELNEGDEYNKNDLMYTSDLETILEDYPENFEEVPSCEVMKRAFKSSYKSSWSDLPTPIHDIWPMILKTCKK